MFYASSEVHEEECGGYCYFENPDPMECLLNVADSANMACYMGNFNTDAPADGLTGLSDTTLYTARFVTSMFSGVVMGGQRGQLSPQ